MFQLHARGAAIVWLGGAVVPPPPPAPPQGPARRRWSVTSRPSAFTWVEPVSAPPPPPPPPPAPAPDPVGPLRLGWSVMARRRAIVWTDPPAPTPPPPPPATPSPVDEASTRRRRRQQAKPPAIGEQAAQPVQPAPPVAASSQAAQAVPAVPAASRGAKQAGIAQAVRQLAAAEKLAQVSAPSDTQPAPQVLQRDMAPRADVAVPDVQAVMAALATVLGEMEELKRTQMAILAALETQADEAAVMSAAQLLLGQK